MEQQAPLAPKHVLVVDDEVDLCELIALRLEHHGYRVTARHDLRGGLAALETQRLDALVLDLRLDGDSGLDLLAAVRAKALELPIVILTADGAVEHLMQAGEGAIFAVVLKPFDAAELVATLQRALA